MIEKDHQEELAQLKLHVLVARRVHRSMIGIAATTSAAVFASLPLAISQETPAWLNITSATAGLLGSTFAIHETEITQAKLNDAKRKIEDYQRRAYLSRLRT